MGLSIAPTGRNSKYIKNSPLSPGKLVMLAEQGVAPLTVDFDIVGREGQFTDATIANYELKGNSTLEKFVRNDVSKALPTFWKGELTTKYSGVVPKTLHFDIIYRADLDLPPHEIIDKVTILQSMCYPRSRIGLNPPLCILHILNLYSLEVYVQEVLVTWHNQWAIRQSGKAEDHGLPMGCDISVSCFMHQYPTRDEILAGAGFDSTRFLGSGFSGSLKENPLTLRHDFPSLERIYARDKSYNTAVLANNNEKAAAQALSKKLVADPANFAPGI